MYRITLAFCAALAFSLAASAETKISYDRDIRPILSKNCLACHGPDEAARKAKLRLDEQSQAHAPREGHAVIVPAKPEESELLKRILSTDPGTRMPPPESGDALTPEQAALIRQWIAEGGEYTKHWAFIAPERPPVPEVAQADWARNPIDHFVLQRLEAEGLNPSPQADKITLLRRLSLDLTGLPPTLEEVDLALADASEGWYAAAVERLLNSPHYGERWARHWLDAAQYADSDGFEKDKPRQVWAWRDYVIKAFNTNKPYDQFIIEQVAGDLLPNAGQEEQVATGFLRNSMVNEEGGIQPEQFRMEALFNRMEILGRGVLGVTVQCAQCHTHKYDPLTHTDYYRMLAFLNNEHEAMIPVYSEDERRQQAEIQKLIAEVEDNIRQKEPDWAAQMAAWEESARALPEPAWQPLELEFDDTSSGGQKFLPQEDVSYLAAGYAPTNFQPKMVAVPKLAKITAVRLDLLTDPNLPRGGPGRSIYGGGALSEFELAVGNQESPIENFDAWTRLSIASAIADANPQSRRLGPEFPRNNKPDKRVTGPIEYAIDGDGETAWTSDIDPGRRNEARHIIFKLTEPLTVPEGARLIFRIAQNHGGWNSDDNQTNNLGRFRISVTDAETLPELALPSPVKQALAVEAAARTPEQQQVLFSHWRATVREFSEANARIDALWQALPSGGTQLVYQERETPRMTHRLDRGDFLSPAEPVTPGVPDFLHPLEVEGTPTRMDFAKWLASRKSPTTARAFVNRVWTSYFGHGLTDSTADFGRQGEPPSHPELLDWLAVEFMDSGWDVKGLHRMITGSASYQQSSNVSLDLLQRDPKNRLIARGARFRVEGEIVRDITLAASGLLNPAIGGPSVNTPAPEFLFVPPASYGPKTWVNEKGADKYRRALYTFRFRSVPYPALQVFDTPAGDAPCTRRERSNSPLQALATLNEPLFFEAARGLAESVLTHGGATPQERIAFAFRRCVAREPEPEEVADVLRFLSKQQERIAKGELNAAEIISAAGGGPAANANELAAWTLTSRVLLNMDETITRQ